MQNCFIFLILLLLTNCTSNAYDGYVYDHDTKKPLRNVVVNDHINKQQTVTNAKGYFYLKHNSQVLGELVFKKAGYDLDTFKTIRNMSGEQIKEVFKGDTIYMFKEHSRFRDSINRLNGIDPR